MSINKNCIYDAGRKQFKKSAFSTKLIYSKSPLEMFSKLTKFFFSKIKCFCGFSKVNCQYGFQEFIICRRDPSMNFEFLSYLPRFGGPGNYLAAV